jgi:methyl-accepting chemotaxis protein
VKVHRLIDENSSKSNFILIIDQTGKVVSSPKSQRETGWLFDEMFAQQINGVIKRFHNEALESERTAYRIDTINKKKQLIGYATNEQTAWHALVVQDTREAFSPIRSLRTQSMLIGLLWVVVTTGVALLLTRSITRPLNQAVAMLADIAQGEGDLTARLEVKSKDEFGELSKLFNTFVEKLQRTIGQVANTATQVASTANGLSSISEQIATGLEESSTQADTVASATEEMSVTAQEIADNCTSAVEAADAATASAESGREVVRQTIDEMNEIAA